MHTSFLTLENDNVKSNYTCSFSQAWYILSWTTDIKNSGNWLIIHLIFHAPPCPWDTSHVCHSHSDQTDMHVSLPLHLSAGRYKALPLKELQNSSGEPVQRPPVHHLPGRWPWCCHKYKDRQLWGAGTALEIREVLCKCIWGLATCSYSSRGLTPLKSFKPAGRQWDLWHTTISLWWQSLWGGLDLQLQGSFLLYARRRKWHLKKLTPREMCRTALFKRGGWRKILSAGYLLSIHWSRNAVIDWHNVLHPLT